MDRVSRMTRTVLTGLLILWTGAAAHAGTGTKAEEPLVDIRSVDPGIRIELRYTTPHNVVGRPIYPADARPLLREGVARRLAVAEAWLRARGYGLKVWDAYRPMEAQMALWQVERDRRFVSDPDNGHALHAWGVAVDCTLVDANGKEVPMPSDLDAFGGMAALHYSGHDATVRADLDLLMHGMGAAGFLGMRTEWWHYVAPDWAQYARVTPEQAWAFSKEAGKPAVSGTR